ncbi:MAG: hypothetical protein PHW79_05600 [Candidatus Marinimicrobia bacterium]|nr:hypothetical protein [Candidatus Neomarinimicrobiota bacterium]
MITERRDKIISRIILAISGGILIYWCYRLIVWLIRWMNDFQFQSAGGWNSFGVFCLDNLSIILVIYVVICLQIAGVVEFRFRKSFIKAFFLGIFMTPPIMLIIMKKSKG